MYGFEDLRNNYPEFIYKGYDTSFTDEGLEVVYRYDIPGLSDFHTRWVFPADRREYSEILDRFIFSLGMVEGISYYKCACPRVFKVTCGNLTPDRVSWWRKLIYKGLGEFQYVNGIEISEDELVRIIAQPEGTSDDTEKSALHGSGLKNVDRTGGVLTADDVPLHDDRRYSGIMVPIGGGKDSVVSLELLRDHNLCAFFVNESDTMRAVAKACDHISRDLPCRRILDKRIIELNKEGYLNGHIPFSAVVAFSTVITAYLNGIKYIALSNEASANESTVKGSFVNHQYSKSFEFEQDFAAYIRELCDSDIHYFSLLRPYPEIRIAALFAKFKGYHRVFRSCNRGSKEGIWCCNCSKCLFVYIILSPFLTEGELVDIFGENLLDKESLDREFRELCGIDENKPFECVGTRSEVCAALKCAGHSLLTDRYADYISQTPDTVDSLVSEVSEEHNIPEEIKYTINYSQSLLR